MESRPKVQHASAHARTTIVFHGCLLDLLNHRGCPASHGNHLLVAFKLPGDSIDLHAQIALSFTHFGGPTVTHLFENPVLEAEFDSVKSLSGSSCIHLEAKVLKSPDERRLQ